MEPDPKSLRHSGIDARSAGRKAMMRGLWISAACVLTIACERCSESRDEVNERERSGMILADPPATVERDAPAEPAKEDQSATREPAIDPHSPRGAGGAAQDRRNEAVSKPCRCPPEDALCTCL
jgi:hypothetical protein